MKYRRLGRTGLKVSEIGLGSWLTYGTTTPANIAQGCIQRALELGINYFDCANMYGNAPHAAECLLGDTLQGVSRGSYVLGTKVFYPVGPGPNDRGLSRKHIMDQVHLSLRAFHTDYIDILYCHRFDPDTTLEETLRALNDLVAQGKVLYVGISEWPPAAIREAVELCRELRLYPIAISQPVYNMLARRIEQEELPQARDLGIGLITFSALGQGVLTGKYAAGIPPEGSRASADDRISHLIRTRYLNPDQAAKVDKLVAVAKELDLTLAQMALAWVLRVPEIACALVGASRPGQLDENVRASDVVLPEGAMREIEAILVS